MGVESTAVEGAAALTGTAGVASKASMVACTLAAMVASGLGSALGVGLAEASYTAEVTTDRMVDSMSGASISGATRFDSPQEAYQPVTGKPRPKTRLNSLFPG